jgi:hypothetical protein
MRLSPSKSLNIANAFSVRISLGQRREDILTSIKKNGFDARPNQCVRARSHFHAFARLAKQLGRR